MKFSIFIICTIFLCSVAICQNLNGYKINKLIPGTGKTWVQNETFKALTKNIVSKKSILTFENNKRELFIPIFPLLDKTEDIVVNDITDKIIELKNEL